jgi:hypothetical protein
MKRQSKHHERRSAIDILEESMHMLRANPLDLMPYYIGSLPFILGLLYFWTDMSIGANAWQHASRSAWFMVFLFVWMKIWQSAYTGRLLAHIRGDKPPRWNVRRILRVAGIQTAIQPWSFIILPVALIILLPFPRTLAFFQNVGIIGAGDEKEMGGILHKSWRQASLWPMQNTHIIWLASPFALICTALLVFVLIPISTFFNPTASPQLILSIAILLTIPFCPLGMITAINIGMALAFIPSLLKTLFDVETIFSMGGPHTINHTFFAIVCGMSYLCLDPLVKASYCLRCFYGESLQSGEDLKVELRSLVRPAALGVVVLAFFLALCPVSRAFGEPETPGITRHENSISSEKLDNAIEKVINRPEYTWRMPREKPPEAEGNSAFYEFLQPIIKILSDGWNYVKRGLARAWQFIRDIFARIIPKFPKIKAPDSSWTSFSRAFIVIPLACVLIVLAFLAWRAWKDRKPRTIVALAEIKTIPDITGDDVDAGALPEDGWLDLARELIEKGELRLALRARYLATLASLARQDLITIARYKSDREYELELRRRSHARPRLAGIFAENRALFESTWYGLHEVTSGIMEQFARNHEEIKGNA